MTMNDGNVVQPTVLVVDDNPDNMTVVSDLLMPFYKVKVAPSGSRALEIVFIDPLPDLILLDVMMPEMDGYEVIKTFQGGIWEPKIFQWFSWPPWIPREMRKRGWNWVLWIMWLKPIHPSILLSRVVIQIELKMARNALENQNVSLEAEVARRMAENEAIKNATISSLAVLAEIRDIETGSHLLRTSLYV